MPAPKGNQYGVKTPGYKSYSLRIYVQPETYKKMKSENPEERGRILTEHEAIVAERDALREACAWALERIVEYYGDEGELENCLRAALAQGKDGQQ